MTDPTAHHVGVTVSDLDRAVSFYRDTFGFDVLSRFSVGGEAFATGVDVDGARADFAHLDADGIRLELVSYDSTGDPGADPTIDDSGATHLALAVEDIDAWYADLPSDIETLSPPQTTESGTTICFLRDPEGNLVEVLST